MLDCFNFQQTPNAKLVVNGQPGDLTGDGKVDIKDAILSLQVAIGAVKPSADQTINGDLNKDGSLNVQDTILILMAIVDDATVSSGIMDGEG